MVNILRTVETSRQIFSSKQENQYPKQTYKRIQEHSSELNQEPYQDRTRDRETH